MLRRGAFAPKQICRQTDSKQNDGSGEILELSRITERQVHGVADDGSRGKDEKNRRPGISWNAVGKRPLFAARNVETRMVSATILPAHEPRTALTEVAAIVSLAAVAAGPRAHRYATMARRYNPIRTSEPSKKARGNAFCGSTTSPAL